MVTEGHSEIIHSLPGRVRCRVPWIKDKPHLALALAGKLRAKDGIHECRANPECASLTIAYDPHRWTPKRLSGRLNALTARDIQRLEE